MSETLSEENVTAIDTLYRYRSEGWALDINRLLASHRAVQAQRDEFRSLNDHHKSEFLATNAYLAEMRRERDALKAELADVRQLIMESEHIDDVRVRLKDVQP